MGSLLPVGVSKIDQTQSSVISASGADGLSSAVSPRAILRSGGVSYRGRSRRRTGSCHSMQAENRGLNAAVKRAFVLPSLLVVGLFLFAAPAQASAPSHSFAFTFGDGEPTTATNVEDPYPLSDPPSETQNDGVAVDQADGDLYVVDYGNHRIEKFNQRGEFLLMVGLNVNRPKAEEFSEPGNPHNVTEAERDICTAQDPAGTCQAGQRLGNGAIPYSGHRPAIYSRRQLRAVITRRLLRSGSGRRFYRRAAAIQKFNSSGEIVLEAGAHGEL